MATAAEDGVVRVWDTRVALLEATPFPRSIDCLRAFRASAEGLSALSRVLVLSADTALVTGDEGNRLLKVGDLIEMAEEERRREEKKRRGQVNLPRSDGSRAVYARRWSM